MLMLKVFAMLASFQLLFFSFIIGLAFNKIYPAVRKKFSPETADFDLKARDLKRRGHRPVDLGADKLFCDFILEDGPIKLLEDIETTITGFEKVYILWGILNIISDELTEHIQSLRSPFVVHSESPAVTSDDVVAFVIYLLCSVTSVDIISNINFVKIFSWYLPSKNQYGYSLVTFEVAVEYIKRCTSQVSNGDEDERRSECKQTDPKHNEDDVSRFDHELEKICPTSAETNEATSSCSGLPDSSENDLGQFLSSLSKRYYVAGYGKQ